MLTKNIYLNNFQKFKSNKKIKNIFRELKENYYSGKFKLLNSLSRNYQYSYNKKLIKKYKKYKKFRIIGIGGSILVS